MPIPSAAPDDSPTLCLAVNAEWMQYVLGCLKQLMLPSTWGLTQAFGDAIVLNAANNLIAMFAEAPLCAITTVAGSYVGGCLSAPVTLTASTMIDVLSITVDPGQYVINARLTVHTDGPNIRGVYLYDGAAYVAETGNTVANLPGMTANTLTAYVDITATTTFTLRVETTAYSDTAVADVVSGLPAGSNTATCLEAIPLGISGPAGPAGPASVQPEIRFTAACGLETSIDSGATWVAVPGWLTNAATCFPGFDGATIPITIIDPGAPPNPQAATAARQACNIASYLASAFIKEAIQQAVTSINANETMLDFGTAALALIPGADIPFGLILGGLALTYTAINSGTLSDYSAALADSVLWSDLTCAIYNAIETVGYVDATNYAAMLTAIAGVSYVHAAVITTIHDFVSGIGLDGVKQIQKVGALNVANCYSCAVPTWCRTWDFTAGAYNTDWNYETGPAGTYTAGVGYQSVTTNGYDILWLASVRNGMSGVTKVRIQGSATASASTAANRAINDGFSQGGSPSAIGHFTLGTGAIDETVNLTAGADHLGIVFDSQDTPATHLNTITTLTVWGTGACPFAGGTAC